MTALSAPNPLKLRPLSLKPLALAALLALGVSSGAQAQSLVELYDMARGFDTTVQSARAQYEANLAKADQAKAGLLPQAGLGAGVNWANVDSSASGGRLG